MNFQKIQDAVYAWLITTGPRLLMGLAIVALGLWLIRVTKRWMNGHLLRKDISSSIRPFLVSLISSVLYVLLALAFLQIVGIQMTIFAAVLGAFGVAAGLALSGTLQNFTSGILILLLKPFRVGDNIRAQGEEGAVTAIQVFYTVMTTFDNRTIIIPNSKLSNEVIVNLSREGTRRLDIEIKLPFNRDFAAVKSAIEAVLTDSQGLLKEPAHRIGLQAIEADGYRVLINVWAPAHGFHDARLALQERLLNGLKERQML